jgi:hypothetical protein
MNVTLPPIVPDVVDATDAVNVTLCPAIDGFDAEISVVLVVALIDIVAVAVSVAFPASVTVTVCEPSDANVTLNVCEPLSAGTNV